MTPQRVNTDLLARAIRVYRMLARRGGATIADPRAALDCSERTAWRYVRAVEAAGVTLEEDVVEGRAHRKVWRICAEAIAVPRLKEGA